MVQVLRSVQAHSQIPMRADGADGHEHAVCCQLPLILSLTQFHHPKFGMAAHSADGRVRKNHWTDGKVREVLEAQNQKLWIQGVKERLKYEIPQPPRPCHR